MTFREIKFGSAGHDAERSLRDEVLRIPLGMSLGVDDLEEERGQWHFGLFDHRDALVACALAKPLSVTEVRLRQIAVASAWQGRGMGRQLIGNVEEFLRKRGIRRVLLHARVAVAEFYERLGYARAGAEFVEISIPHVEMTKWISDGGSVSHDDETLR